MTDKLQRIYKIKTELYKLESEIIREMGTDTITRSRHQLLYRILGAVAQAFHLTVEEISSKRKTQDKVIARMTFVHLARKVHYPWTRIAAALKRHHSTMIYYEKTDFEERRWQYPEFEKNIKQALILSSDFVTPEQSTPASVGDVLTGQTMAE